VKLGKLRSGAVSLTGLFLLTVVSAGTPVSAGPGKGSPESTSRYIVSLRGLAPDSRSVAVAGSSVGATAPGAVRAERARIARISRRVAGLESHLGFRTGTRYRHALQGFAASLTPGQVSSLRANPGILAVSPVLPVHPAAEDAPAGVRRVHAGLSDPAPSPHLADVNVAVLDTGIRYLAGAAENELTIAGGIDCAKDGKVGQTTPEAWRDVDGHGTHVAGTIGAKNTGEGVIGVAPGVRLWAVRIFANEGGNIVGDTETVACGVDWVASTRSVAPPAGTSPIDVANMSIQGPKDTVNDGDTCTPTSPATPPTDPEHTAICEATTAGVTFVVAAGNQGRDARNTVPAVYDEVITVASMADYDGQPDGLGAAACGDGDDSFSAFSNYGSAVDLIAPGTCIVSLGRAAGALRTMSGTSMAAPHVTGAAARYVALLLEQGVPHDSESINVAVVKDALRASAGFNWNTSSDPDGVPDRLLDVQALTAAPSLAATASPAVVALRAPAGDPAEDSPPATFSVELQRFGLYPGEVTISNDGLPEGVSWDPPAAMAGIGQAGISQTITFHASNLAADGSYPVTLHATGAGEGAPSATAGLTLTIDRTRPTIGALEAQIVGGTLSSAVPVRIAWAGSDAGGPISRYELQRKVGTSGWQGQGLSSPSSTSTVKLIAPKVDYTFRARAVDAVGNVGDWSPDLTLRLGIRDSSKPTISYAAGAWTTRHKANAHGKSYRTTSSVGAWAGVSFTGQGVAWVAPVGPSKGIARIQLDGSPPILVNLERSSAKARRIVWASGPLAPGAHHLVITVVSGPVDLDAILLLS
jgi:subtilisin family serine protease